MRFIKEVPDIELLQANNALNDLQKKSRESQIKEIHAIMDGADKRKLLIVGPCSADREDAVLEYMTRLAGLKEKVKDSFLIIPRVYTSKPRTNGLGYKGLLHRPNPTSANDDLLRGLVATRRIHYRVITETGLFGADEMLYPDVFYYYMDLVCYAAVGARSVEDQQHRLVASGLDIPVGMKNPTSGDLKVMLNAISAGRHANAMIFHGWITETEGNPYAHAILRGYEDINGNVYPNYHYENICKLYDMFHSFNIDKPAVILDCNHSNSGKHYDEQIRIAEDVIHNCSKNKVINGFVKGLMIESYLLDGNQMTGEGIYGRSITDPCLGWDKTEQLILGLADRL
ncbi:MAG: 3-deoxy-7-phosphoheptulonate synthase [Clostridia bacterium]|nr:3-deoxy-7-phosphoheptulonate synthase [Clostridia bacterium]